MNELALLIHAVDFSAQRHRSQSRKGTERTPYINHPIGVANLLANEGGEKDIPLMIAAVLHDVVEDTVGSETEKQELMVQIAQKFGQEVLSLVMEVTDDKNLDKAERKRLQIEHAPTLSDRAKKLKLADKILNIRDVTDDPPMDWPRQRIVEYIFWSEKVVAGLRGVNPKLDQLFDESLARAKMLVGIGPN